MSEPSLDLLFEVELLQWVQLSSAPSHDVRISGDLIGHIEVADVVDQRSSIHGHLAFGLMSLFLEAGTLNNIKLHEMRAELSQSSS